MPRLEVNVDHIATLRQARLIDEPDPVTAAALAELAGADGIIVHLREDRRHIQDRDLRLLRQTIKTRLNLEMAATEEMLEISIETTRRQAQEFGWPWQELFDFFLIHGILHLMGFDHGTPGEEEVMTTKTWELMKLLHPKLKES